MIEPGYWVAGFAVGCIVGLTGVGGGSLMTPILIFFFGIKPNMAVGTDLLFAAITKLGGTVSLSFQRLGPASPSTLTLMTSTLGVALLLTAAALLFKAVRGKSPTPNLRQAPLDEAIRARHWALPVVFGAVIGVLVTLTLMAGLGHATLGSVDWPLLLQLLSGSLPGIWIGARCMRHVPERWVRGLLSILLALAGTKLLTL